MKASDLPLFRVEEVLTTGERVGDYLLVVLEEEDPAELLDTLHTLALAEGLTEFAERVGRPADELRAGLAAEPIDPLLVLDMVRAVGWGLAPLFVEVAQAA